MVLRLGLVRSEPGGLQDLPGFLSSGAKRWKILVAALSCSWPCCSEARGSGLAEGCSLQPPCPCDKPRAGCPDSSASCQMELFNTGAARFVTTRAWSHLPSVVFLFFGSVLVVLHLSCFLFLLVAADGRFLRQHFSAAHRAFVLLASVLQESCILVLIWWGDLAKA